MRKGTCKYFTGTAHNKCCKIGIPYDSVTTDPGTLQGKGLRIACHSEPLFLSVHQLEEFNRRGMCDKYQEPTNEEIAAFEKSMNEAMENHIKVIEIISPIRKEQKGKNWRGVIECPICKGRLHLSHAAYNGHMHGKCEAKDCISWME